MTGKEKDTLEKEYDSTENEYIRKTIQEQSKADKSLQDMLNKHKLVQQYNV